MIVLSGNRRSIHPAEGEMVSGYSHGVATKMLFDCILVVVHEYQNGFVIDFFVLARFHGSIVVHFFRRNCLLDEGTVKIRDQDPNHYGH